MIYELVWSDALDSELSVDSSVPLPPAGPAPFASSERAVYEFTWETAPTTLLESAGTVTISARGSKERDPACSPADGSTDLRPENASQASYHLTTVARTSKWVSTMFEAQDCFVSWTDGAWEPLVVEQKRHEGRRNLNLEFDYDWPHHEMKIRGQFAVPIAAGSRDPLSALYYVRSLPLKPGDEVTIPVIEKVRKLLVHVRAAGMDSIVSAGRSVEALRLELTLIYAVQTRTPMQISLWLSNDDRHLPIRMRIATDFGIFRGDLTSYQAEP